MAAAAAISTDSPHKRAARNAAVDVSPAPVVPRTLVTGNAGVAP